MAVRILCQCSGVESDWCGFVRLLHQSSACALLHAGAQHDRNACSRSIVRRLWHARNRADVVLHAGPFGSVALERTLAWDIVLVPQYRARDDGVPVAFPAGTLPN